MKIASQSLRFWRRVDRVERLAPPLLEDFTIDEKIKCVRPMREGKFNISTERKGDKILVHCYGHGGAGCTTSFGTVRKAIDLYEKEFAASPKVPIRVIGVGIIGLTAAIELALRGYEVAGITAKEFFDIPSLKNAGYFALVSVKTEKREQENLDQMGLATFKEYKKIHEGKHPYISSECVRLMPVYCSRDTETGVENLERANLFPEREPVTIDFGNGVVHKNFIKYTTYFMDTTRIMLQLKDKVFKLKIPLEKRALFSFSEIAESVIFNCSGLGAKELNDDDKMISVRGHLINLNAAAGNGHMNYMIYSKFEAEGEEGTYVYSFPKSLQITEAHQEGKPVFGTLGGTFIHTPDSMTPEEMEKLDADEFKKLYDRNALFFWGKNSIH